MFMTTFTDKAKPVFFDIKNDQKPLIKNLLTTIEQHNPQHATQIETEASTWHVMFLMEQLDYFGFIELVGQHWFITFDGKDLLNRLGV
ncbi:hypothetical protein HJ158_08165 [Vibrio parahaemolyticus]|nr:hypothetical protein [Vibrio parahaemolyticus]